ncbi:MAG: chemotaxis protein CheW [Candidatus Heimdallarchaeota archaeon]|nr:MAG: chemotaxis protein CheW [Candidatus Heimdallarchaeota archaeon]
MSELDEEPLKIQSNLFLVVKLDSTELAVPIDQIDGISDFVREMLEDTINLSLGRYYLNNQSIPILNLKKYLDCPDPFFTHTLQSRIVFLTSLNRNLTIGIGFEAICGIFRNISETTQRKSEDRSNSSTLSCFNLDSYIKDNSKVYPILDLEKLVDFSHLRNIFHPQ